ncbi:MAG: YihY/virulence factor BrkB family protein [Actinobacteria bacterium]|nr:YihY/virulence factor BrkB family protein [Actinomycetota bacterium]
MKTIWKLIQRARRDGCTGLAGMIAYNFFLALPIVLILIATVLALLPVGDIVDEITRQLSGLVPSDVLSLLTRVMRRTLRQGAETVPTLLLSLLGALYVMNNGYAGLISSLNRIFGFEERRRWLRVRLQALILSVVAAFFIIAALALALVAPLIIKALSDDQGFNQVAGVWLDRLRWPAILILALVGIESTYRYAPSGRLRFGLVSPGTLFATGSWLVATLGFGYYVNNYSSYQNVYGSLGSVIVLLTWMWISAMTFLIGAEINVMWREWRDGRFKHPDRVDLPAPDV